MSWVIDPSSGDYVMTNGAPVDSPDLKMPSYYRLKIKRQQWLYAPDAKYGSDYYKVLKNFTTKPQTQLEQIGARALQPIVDDGRATAIDVTVTGVGRNAVSLELDVTSGQNQTSTIQLKGLGVV
jgi:phage gp46-like protein